MQFSRDIKWPRQNTSRINFRSFILTLSGFTICAPAGYLSGLAREASRLGPERLQLDQSSLTENFFDIWSKGLRYCLMYLPIALIALAPVFMVLMGADADSLSMKVLFKLVNGLVSCIGLIWLPLVYLREITRQETESRYDYAAIFGLLCKNIKTVLMLTFINIGYSVICALALFVIFGIWGILLFFGLLLLKAVPIVAMCIFLALIPLFAVAFYYGFVVAGYLQIAFACAVGFHVYENGLGDSFVRTDFGYDYSSGSRTGAEGGFAEAGAFGAPVQGGAVNNQYNENNYASAPNPAPAAGAAPVASFTPVGVGIAENPNENIEINIGDGTDRYY